MIIFEAPTRTLTLRNPRLGNTFTGDTHTTVKRAMDGTYYAYKTTPEIWTMKWEFDYIDRAKVLETNLFMKLTAGQQMKVTTYDGFIWSGKIISRFEMTAVKVSDNKFSIFFEGVKQ